MSIRDKVIEEFKILLQENIRNIDMIVKVAEDAKLTNEQYYLDWEDYLNKISVMEH